MVPCYSMNTGWVARTLRGGGDTPNLPGANRFDLEHQNILLTPLVPLHCLCLPNEPPSETFTTWYFLVHYSYIYFENILSHNSMTESRKLMWFYSFNKLLFGCKLKAFNYCQLCDKIYGERLTFLKFHGNSLTRWGMLRFFISFPVKKHHPFTKIVIEYTCKYVHLCVTKNNFLFTLHLGQAL